MVNRLTSTWVPTSNVNMSCFWFHVRLPLLWLTEMELYMFVEPTRFGPRILFSFYKSIWSNQPTSTWVPTSTINISCFWLNMRSPLLSLTKIDLYIFVEPKRFELRSIFSFSKSIWSNKPMSSWIATSFENTSCFWFHMRLPLLLLTKMDLYMFLEPRRFGLRFFLLFCKSVLANQPQARGFPLHHQHVVFWISYAVASTLAYEDGFVYMCGTKETWTPKLFVYLLGNPCGRINSQARGFRPPPSTCRVFGWICDCVDCGLHTPVSRSWSNTRAWSHF